MQTKNTLEIGLYSLADHLSDPYTGKRVSVQERIHEIIQLAQAADQAGLDFFGLGESHQSYFVGQAHRTILAAIAQSTKQIRLGSASTIISTADPVRVFEDFASLDLISNGRMEIIAGRASRVGLFDLLGYDIEDYDALFDEKFELLRLINRQQPVTWSGTFRPPLNEAYILPRPLQDQLPIWRAVGGGPQSAVAAGRAGVPMFMAQLAGPVESFRRTVDSYRQAGQEQGYAKEDLTVATAGWLFLGEDAQSALEHAYPYVNEGMKKTNGSAFPKRSFAHGLSEESVILAGNSNQIVDRLLYQYETFGMQRYCAQIDFGGLPFDQQMKTVEVLASEVLPQIKKHTSK